MPDDAPQGQTPGVDRLRPVEAFTGSLAQKTYQTLREAIIGLIYRPGEALKKPEICERLGVSRSPVSEAIARLAAEGLVDVVPQAGTFVARFSMEEIREGAFRREAIELAAVEEIAPRMTEAQLVELRRNLRVQEVLVEDGDFAGFYKMDGEMHALILSLTGHRKLVQVADTAWVHVNRARQLVLPMQGRVEETLAEHRAILDALEARDPEGARQAMRRHLRQLLTHLEPLERDHPELFLAERKV
ncbi:GntR family transcriptional regulator [Solirhodobacter olei]|uniref:GntR family transcriptional regulator n=1 Tax=Solirhodobacter olei TaxID=2493082 RepID=UPI000FD6DFDB|nr:GntR family transcriptional regulator [Solirhodobacter olei]